YWTFTVLLALGILLTSISNVMVAQDSIDLISVHLGYPQYIIPFLGIAKVLAAIALVVPMFPRLKEWAYAGIVFDLAGAIYSSLAKGDQFVLWIPMIIVSAILIGGSSIYHHKRLKASQA